MSKNISRIKIAIAIIGIIVSSLTFNIIFTEVIHGFDPLLAFLIAGSLLVTCIDIILEELKTQKDLKRWKATLEKLKKKDIK